MDRASSRSFPGTTDLAAKSPVGAAKLRAAYMEASPADVGMPRNRLARPRRQRIIAVRQLNDSSSFSNPRCASQPQERSSDSQPHSSQISRGDWSTLVSLGTPSTYADTRRTTRWLKGTPAASGATPLTCVYGGAAVTITTHFVYGGGKDEASCRCGVSCRRVHCNRRRIGSGRSEQLARKL